jgi:hypothetical protein
MSRTLRCASLAGRRRILSQRLTGSVNPVVNAITTRSQWATNTLDKLATAGEMSMSNEYVDKQGNWRMDMPIHELREVFTWGTYGIGGSQELQHMKLCQLTDNHIQAIIDDGYAAAPIMQLELDYRRSIK